MSPERRVDELVALKEIAETLNMCNDMQQMLQAVLGKVLEVTGLKTGWIFLLDEKPEYACVADQNLPPALSWGEKTPMCTDTCWCVDKYWGRRLEKAVNIINCKRIENAIEFKWGDTKGIYHHATVPLKAGGEWFGLLNVAAPDKVHFSDEELALLESVAYQIGTAIKRTKLFHSQQRRAEMYTKLGEIVKRFGQITSASKIPAEAVAWLGKSFQWHSVAFFVQEANILSLRALCAEGKVMNQWNSIVPTESGPVGAAIGKGRLEKLVSNRTNYPKLLELGVPAFSSAVAVPLQLRGQTFGALFVTSEKQNGFDENDLDLLQSISEHISLAMENARLDQQRQELAKVEERNRLARDLHDSVCQNLFSLTLMTSGLASALPDREDWVTQSLREISQLTEDSLKEMRSLIWQLRPAGLEQGLLTALKQYGEKLGLTLFEKLEGVYELPRAVEETLWRIGQEALNNVSKHAGVAEVAILLKITKRDVKMTVRDEGSGFLVGQNNKQESMGMLSMRERAEMLGGIFTIESKPGAGTTVQVYFPNLFLSA